MEKAKLVIDGLVNTIKEQIDVGMDKNSLWDINDFDIDTGGNENVEDVNMAEMEENFYKGYKG